ncbi:oxidoreductase [Nocardioides sp.]|uniref:oxidoreductase n=1 Tax=Nocardioides sp. TaxID=35761 RepID=UPI00261B4903|nr:oxidoreductase [Nocardioides sp.]
MSAADLAAAVAIGTIGALDAVFSGLRASLGRTGLIDHRAQDRAGLRRGAAVGVLALVPATLVLALSAGGWTGADLGHTARTMLLALAPYAILVVGALIVYRALSWRLTYLASAVILGPMTFLRPAIALAAAILGTLAAESGWLVATVWLGTLGLLAVEPLCGPPPR